MLPAGCPALLALTRGTAQRLRAMAQPLLAAQKDWRLEGATLGCPCGDCVAVQVSTESRTTLKPRGETQPWFQGCGSSHMLGLLVQALDVFCAGSRSTCCGVSCTQRCGGHVQSCAAL